MRCTRPASAAARGWEREGDATLGRLLGLDVALEGMSALELARSRLAEALGRRTVGLHLWHCWCSRLLFLIPVQVVAGATLCRLEPANNGLTPACRKTGRTQAQAVTGARPAGQYSRAPEPAAAPDHVDFLPPGTGAPGGSAARARSSYPRSPPPDRHAAGRRPAHLRLGAIIITISRPSCRGRCSTTISSPGRPRSAGCVQAPAPGAASRGHGNGSSP